MKEAYYFPHDSNARMDVKILALRSVYKAEGYGLFWMLIEKMRDATGYKLPISGKYDIDAIAMDLQYDVEKVKSFIQDCIYEFHLFDSDGEFVWSNSLLVRMKLREEKSSKASKSARLRWDKAKQMCDNDANALRSQNGGNAIKQKEIKRKEKREDNNKEEVSNTYRMCLKVFSDYYLTTFSTAYLFDSSKDGRHLKELIKKIEAKCKESCVNPTPEKVCEGFHLFLGTIKDKWVLDNLSISLINSQFNKLFKNALSSSSTKKSAIDDYLNHFTASQSY